ncbi:twitching motility protein PilT [Pasteurellaceae bacterium RH1A]|nr:twitching motility protein PilT [Pasteurellaceae bacterium RH1A]
MYLLDTNVISEIRRAKFGKCNTGVLAWIKGIQPSQIYTSTVVLMEIERGVLSMERKDVPQGQILRTWFEEQVKTTFKDQTFGLDEQTAHLCAQLHIPYHAPENDAWIAATAKQHNLILVTRNIKDFENFGVKLLNPFVE